MADSTRQYASAKSYADAVSVSIPNAVSPFDQARLRTYTLYEDFYTNVPDSFRVILRGEDSEQQQIYVPSSETIIEAICRFHAVDVGFELSESNDEVQSLLENLWDREAFALKHTANKRWGCVRGDSAFYLTADESKPKGARISLHDLDPSTYFPIVDKVDGKEIGCYLVEPVTHPDPKKKELAAKRQTYMRERNALTGAFTGRIIYDSRVFTQGKWDDRTLEQRDIEQLQVLVEPKYLPAQIKSIPIYLIPNAGLQNAMFGRSELAGIETLIAAVNQTMTDEDITLAIAGLGMYSTDATPPKDAAGNPVPWEFGPARMIEVPDGKTIARLGGVNSVTPMLDHISKAAEFMQQGKGVPEIAVGRVDVQTAESGISLRLQLGPILAKGKEKEAVRAAKQNQMWYDLIHMWFPAYEEVTPPATLRCKTTYGDAMPRNDKEVFDNHVAVFNLGVYPAAKFYDAINALNYGFDLQATDFDKAQEERKAMTEAGTPIDPLAERMASEFNSDSSNQDTNSIEVLT